MTEPEGSSSLFSSMLSRRLDSTIEAVKNYQAIYEDPRLWGRYLAANIHLCGRVTRRIHPTRDDIRAA